MLLNPQTPADVRDQLVGTLDGQAALARRRDRPGVATQPSHEVAETYLAVARALAILPPSDDALALLYELHRITIALDDGHVWALVVTQHGQALRQLVERDTDFVYTLLLEMSAGYLRAIQSCGGITLRRARDLGLPGLADQIRRVAAEQNDTSALATFDTLQEVLSRM